ncbi:reverse transcriptase domain-containing protein, partial [Tanacetum coccineum]
MASLNRFLSKSVERSLPLFKTLKKCIKKSDFHWTPEAEQAFKQLKQHLSKLPLLVAPKPKEELIVYLFATHGAISVVLMTERGTVQTSVYFVSRILQGPKLNYTPMEKLVLSLVFAAKRLQRTTTKMERHAGRTQYHLPVKDVGEKTDPGGLPCKEAGQKSARHISCRNPFTASNNEAEYEALIAGLQIAAQMGVRNVQVLVEILKEKSIQEKEVEAIVEEEGPTWMTPIIEYLKDCTLTGDYVIREIHEGSCSMHAGPQSVVAKAMRLGYYWPTMHRDARDMIRVSPVDINPINSSADEEGGTTVVGCENDSSIQKSNGLATSKKEMETRETVKSVGSKKMTRSIRKDSSRQDSQSQENVSPLLVLAQ